MTGIESDKEEKGIIWEEFCYGFYKDEIRDYKRDEDGGMKHNRYDHLIQRVLGSDDFPYITLVHIIIAHLYRFESYSLR